MDASPSIAPPSGLLLDWLGQFLFFAGLTLTLPSLSLLIPVNHFLRVSLPGWFFVFCLLLYPLLGWLFGSYTVLRWRRLPFLVLIQRLLITASFSLILVSIARWLFNPGYAVWVLDARLQASLHCALLFWSLMVRIALRRGLLLPDSPRLLLLSSDDEMPKILQAWSRVSSYQHLEPIPPAALEQLLNAGAFPLLVALSPSSRHEPTLSDLIELLEKQDPRLVQTISVISLFDSQQERLPPRLLGDSTLSYEDLPWAAPLSVQVQLKRLADLFIAAVLLLATAPCVLLAGLFIWLEDKGPIFYRQRRSGWLGRPFTLYKLRTMREQPKASPALWTQPGDQRITVVGHFLRRLRIDELPQLLNVLNGEMSLIGPRPERPELEHDLESHIPHYRKRHWMRPGLSGWAQVCAPYASSIDDSDLKLSYDLYYLRHFSSLLDIVILLRTIKTVLKAGGR